ARFLSPRRALEVLGDQWEATCKGQLLSRLIRLGQIGAYRFGFVDSAYWPLAKDVEDLRDAMRTKRPRWDDGRRNAPRRRVAPGVRSKFDGVFPGHAPGDEPRFAVLRATQELNRMLTAMGATRRVTAWLLWTYTKRLPKDLAGHFPEDKIPSKES